MHGNNDIRLLFATRIARLFAYGFLSVVLLLFLTEIGLNENRIGLLLSLTLIGDTVISLGITTSADRIGRKKMLILGALLMLFAGALFTLTRNFALLVLAAMIGVISPSGSEVGPFLSIEQAALSSSFPPNAGHRYLPVELIGVVCDSGLGALAGGVLTQSLQSTGVSQLGSYQRF